MEVVGRDLDYWIDQLSGASHLELPTDRPRSAAERTSTASVEATLSLELCAAIERLAPQHAGSLHITLLAAFHTLLHRYTHQDDISIGTCVRRAGPTELAVIRASLAGNPRFIDLLERVNATVREAAAHPVPFERVVDALRASGPSPLVQVHLVDAGSHVPAVGAVDLTITFEERPDGVILRGVFATDLFDTSTIERMLGHFRTLLEGVVAAPSCPIGALPLMTERERHQLLVEWNASAREFPRDRCLHELFEACVDRAPDAIAVVHGESQLTYGELEHRANQLAHHLRALGVGPEVRVGLCTRRSLDMIVGLLGILKAGGGYVPLDPGAPPDRLAFIGTDCSLPVVIAQAATEACIAHPSTRVVRVDADWPEIARAPDTRPVQITRPDNLAYIIYTSGSTGRPKGVQLEHRQVVNSAHAFAELLSIRPTDRMAQLSSLQFDASVLELFTSLCFGAALVLRGDDLPSADELFGPQFGGVTAMCFSTSYWNAIVGHPPPASLRVVICGGDRLQAEHARTWSRLAPSCELINGYGPTESAVAVTAATVHVDRLLLGHDAPIGVPLGNCTIYLLDSYGQPVPIGVPGELYAGGANVARGYLNRPELTAERFVANPFGPGRLYRTGDFARWLPDGNLEFVGRMDNQVKVRGYRIELGEIESALVSLPGVKDAAVVARRDAGGDKRLVAYVVSTVSPTELRDGLAATLPAYMIPSAFVSLDALPLTRNGKVDRQALPDDGGGQITRGYTAPQTPTETRLAEILEDLLQLERVGRDDDFFALGGHSLLATRLVSRIHSAFGIKLAVRGVFEAPTLRALASTIDATGRDTAPPLVPVRRDGELLASFGQQRMWFVAQFAQRDAYDMSSAVRLRGPLDTAALERGVDALVARHEVLRTTYVEGTSGLLQTIHPPRPRALPIVDVDSYEEALTRCEEATRLPFDLTTGPLFESVLFRIATDDHLLLWRMHHIVGDEWSMEILATELAALYEGRELSPLGVQYADFAAWQRAHLTGDLRERQLAYWRAQLADAPPLELPTDRPPPAVPSSRGATVELALPAELQAALEAIGRQHAATPYMTLLAAFYVLLHRYAQQDDISVGTPVANRGRPETDALIGFFINTVVLRTSLSGNPSFTELLARVREVALAAYAHQDVPFEHVVDELRPMRTNTSSPLFRVMFVAHQEIAAPSIAGIEATSVELARDTAHFDLTITVEQRPEGPLLRGELATDQFDATTIERMLGHYRTLLEAIVADPSRRIGELPLMTVRERQQVLVDWNSTAHDHSNERCIHELFEAHVDRAPDAIAVELEGQRLTYGQLDERANQLAHHLRSLGVGPEVPVGLCLHRSLDLMVGLFAILKAGGAYIPLDPNDPRERIAFILEDAAIPVVIVHDDVADRVEHAGTRLVRIGADQPTIAHCPTARPSALAGPSNLAYVIYTSGSTGRPKGVQVEHRMIVNFTIGGAARMQIVPRDRVSQLMSLSFDGSLSEVFPALCSGAALVLRGDEMPSAEELCGEKFAGVTVMLFPTGYWHAIVGMRPPPHLRLVTVGGDRVIPSAVSAWLEHAPGCALLNWYGPTEATVAAVTAFLHDKPLRPGREAPIGSPLPNYQVYVLDRYGQPTPVGVPGELHIAGPGVARGYLGNPDLTAQRFVANPFGPGQLYRTGDLVRWFPDGDLEFVGRVDQQVKVRGYRIELGEIHSVLVRQAGVEDAVVVARSDAGGDKRLVAYVVGTRPVTELRDALAAELPAYMIPSAFVAMNALPLTRNGKVDRNALPDDGGGSLARSYIAPHTPVEMLLAEIWADLLKVERIGRDDDFFALGGHSLLATRLVSRIHSTFRIKIAVRVVFESPTLRALASAIDAASRDTTPPLVPVGRDRPLLASFGQQRFWVLAQVDAQDAYDMSEVYRFGGALDEASLARAMDALVARQEVLRTTLAELDGHVVQRVQPASTGVLAIVNAASYEEARTYCERAVQRPHDLTRSVFEPVLLRINSEDHLLLLRMHHVVGDAWSMDVLWRELEALYQGRALAPLALQYADFAAWQRSWLVGDVLERQLTYWCERLRGAEPLDLPTDRPRPAVLGTRGAVARRTLPARLGPAMETVGRAHNTTRFMTWLGAFYVLLHRYSHQTDFSVGTPVTHRERAETDDLIGYFVNTVVLRANLANNPRFADLLTQIREIALGAYAHQDVPFERVLEALRVPRDLARSPLFQTMFVFRDAMHPSFAGLSVQPVELAHEVSSFDLTLFVEQSAQGVECAIEYNTDLFDAETIDRLLGHYQQLVESIVTDATRTIGTLQILDAGERKLLLEDWNATARDYPRDQCLHQLVEAQVDLRPDAIAVELDGVQLTYRELEARANQLAHHLITLGAGPDVKVGVFLLRSIDMIVAILGVLKAGSGYVPLETKAPADRLAFILSDAAAPLVVTQDSLLSMLGESTARMICLDGDAPLLAREPTTRPRSPVRPEHVAYVIYTSGSTGRPKGVQVEHRNIVNLVTGSSAVEEVTPADRLLQFSSVAFGSSVEEIFTPLASGATIVLRGEDVPSALELFGPRFPNVTVMNMTTAYWHAIVAGLRGQEVPPPGALRLINIGGERALPESLKLWHQLLPGCALNNQYGPSETTVMATWWRLDPSQLEGREAPIGRPLPNYNVYVLDARGEPVPVGVTGELYIGGESVARGYLDRPELTAEKFLPNPFAPGRVYRTGDVVRWRADGNLEFVRRVDDQVKIRGFRVELGEIETVLTQHPAVESVAVLARPVDGGERQLVAYVVFRTEVSPDDLGAFLRTRLPSYMVPARLVILEKLPLSATGKINKLGLPDVPGQALTARSSTPPQGELETLLAAIWCELLKLEEVSRHDNFFEIGGHSLLAVKLVERLGREGHPTSVRELFLHPTLAELAASLETGSPTVDEFSRVENLEQVAMAIALPTLRPGSPATGTGAVLVTGGTGFVGSYIVHTLLRTTSYRVVCPVRAASDLEAAARVRKTFEKYRLPVEGLERVVGIAADLAEPRLGLTEERFEHLAGSVDMIFHSGAMVNFVAPYRLLEATNIGGTVEMLALSAAGRGTPLHFVSTAGFVLSDGKQRFIGDEQIRPEQITAEILDGYNQTKWVAERLVARAADAGFPVRIYRLGAVAGTTQWPLEDNFYWRLLQTQAQMGAFAAADFVMELTPVEFAADAIVAFALTPGSLDGLYCAHIFNPVGYHNSELGTWFQSNGVPMKELPYTEWEQQFLALARSRDTPLQPYLSVFMDGTSAKESESMKHGYELLCTATAERLARLGIRCPTSRELFDTYFAFIGTS